jgi:hypothetical protein
VRNAVRLSAVGAAHVAAPGRPDERPLHAVSLAATRSHSRQQHEPLNGKPARTTPCGRRPPRLPVDYKTVKAAGATCINDVVLTSVAGYRSGPLPGHDRGTTDELTLRALRVTLRSDAGAGSTRVPGRQHQIAISGGPAHGRPQRPQIEQLCSVAEGEYARDLSKSSKQPGSQGLPRSQRRPPPTTSRSRQPAGKAAKQNSLLVCQRLPRSWVPIYMLGPARARPAGVPACQAPARHRDRRLPRRSGSSTG